MNIETLQELGEWAAVGFCEGLELPYPRAYGLAYRRMYENMDVVAPKNNYLIPHEPFANARNFREHGLWTAQGLILDFDHNSGLRISGYVADEKKKLYPQHTQFIDEMPNFFNEKLPRFGGYTHSNPDIRRVVGEGVLAMEKELDYELSSARKAEAADEINLLLALKDYCEGVKSFHAKSCAAAREAHEKANGERKVKLALIAEALPNAFLKPAQNFLQGLLAINITWMLDGCDSIGRVDQMLGDLLERDLDSGIISIEFVRELLDEWFNNFEKFSGWNIQIGGYTPQGKDGCNRLTEELILAAERNSIIRPNLAFRITKDTPEDHLKLALRAVSGGSGRPAIYNDDLYIKTLLEMNLGLCEEDAREVGFGGCTETMIAGMSNVGSLEGYINLGHCLQLALYDGFDPVKKEQGGPHSGKLQDMANFDDFLAAVKRQILHATDSFATWSKGELKKRFTQGDPKLYRTFFTRDCVKNHKSFEAGGARYNWAIVSYQGVANLIDSVAAVRQLVFEEKSVGGQELLEILDADFEGNENLRQRMMALPKYGNDDRKVDELGRELIEFAWTELARHETPRGGRYLPSVILFNTYASAGRQIAATPDGRHAFETLTDSVGAAQGRDVKGPTALLNSVATLPLNLAIGSPVLNVRLQKNMLQSDEQLTRMAALIRSFFAKGGMQLQFAVIDSADMRAAQKDPEKYGHLIVRVGGYSAYFASLDKDLQDSIIQRTEHGV